MNSACALMPFVAAKRLGLESSVAAPSALRRLTVQEPASLGTGWSSTGWCATHIDLYFLCHYVHRKHHRYLNKRVFFSSKTAWKWHSRYLTDRWFPPLLRLIKWTFIIPYVEIHMKQVLQIVWTKGFGWSSNHHNSMRCWSKLTYGVVNMRKPLQA
jgi:hypothetical protein